MVGFSPLKGRWWTSEYLWNVIFNGSFRYSGSCHYFCPALITRKWNKAVPTVADSLSFNTENIRGEDWRTNIRLSLFLYYTTNKRHLQTAFSILPNLHYQNIHAAQQQQPGNYAHSNNHSAACIFIYLCSIIGKQMPVKNPQSKCRQNNTAVKKYAVNNHKHA